MKVCASLGHWGGVFLLKRMQKVGSYAFVWL